MVANGTAKEDSDVDHILVATDEEFRWRESEASMHYFTPDLWDAFLETPTVRACDALCADLVDFMNLRAVEEGWISRFVIDTE